MDTAVANEVPNCAPATPRPAPYISNEFPNREIVLAGKIKK